MPRPPSSWSPTGAHPTLLVDRDDVRADLRDELLAFLEREDPNASGMWTVIGGKGIGKTVLTRAVLEEVRAARSGDTVIAAVDCRTRRSWREVLAQLCWALVSELRELKEIKNQAVSVGLLTEAQLLEELAKLDKAELQTIHERALSYRAGLKAELPTELLSVLPIYRRIGDLRGQAVTLTDIAGLRLAQGDGSARDDATGLLSEACRTVVRIGLPAQAILDIAARHGLELDPGVLAPSPEDVPPSSSEG